MPRVRAARADYIGFGRTMLQKEKLFQLQGDELCLVFRLTLDCITINITKGEAKRRGVFRP